MPDAATEVEQRPAPSESVTVAYVHQNKVTYSWHHSMVELVGHDLVNHARILSGGYIAMRCGSDGLVEARNRAVKEFLRDKPADWLFWIDTDMGFAPDTIDRLLAVADPVERPVVGGLCFSMRETDTDNMGGWRTAPTPTIFDWAHSGDQMGFAVRWEYPINSVVQAGGTGSACILIHRSVFERIEQAHGPIWYNRVPNTSTGQLVSEDLSFCLRMGALGIPLFIHTGVRTTHMKPTWVAEEDYWRHNAVPATVPAATDEVAVIVPVMRRPQNAKPFMESLRATSGLARVYAVCDLDDESTAYAWANAGATVLYYEAGYPESAGTFAQKMNHGLRETREPWLFLVGDDVRFHAGWLDHAQHVARTTGAKVIGTNDLGNPRVVNGDHATHLLIARDYINTVGASWDGPGVVAHEGYRHWFVDDEIVTAAKQRGVWAMAHASRVEHLHPLFGKGADDEVYRLGQSHAEADKKLFESRLATHLKGSTHP